MNRLTVVLALALVLVVGGLAMAQSEPAGWPGWGGGGWGGGGHNGGGNGGGNGNGNGNGSTYDPVGEPLPPNAQPAPSVSEWSDEEEKWVDTSNAEAYNSGASVNGHCNRECWDFEMETHVSVAQWIDFEVNGSRRDWRVLKPGRYAADSIKLRVKSNNDVRLTYWAEPVEYLNPDATSPDIDTMFGFTKGSGTNPNMVSNWVKGTDFTADAPFEFILPYEDVSGAGATYHLYEQIEVTEAHRSSDYHGTAYFNVCVTNLKYWVDPGTGGFNGATAPEGS